MKQVRLYNSEDLSLSEVMGLLARRIQQTRILHNLTQREFAHHCHLSVRTIRNLEAGKSISLASWLTAQKCLGYQPDLVIALDKPKALNFSQFETLATNKTSKKNSFRQRASRPSSFLVSEQ